MSPSSHRSFTTLSSMAEEIGISRIYGGIHFNYSNLDGRTAGKELAHYAFANALNREGMAGPDVEPAMQSTLPLRNCKVLSGIPQPVPWLRRCTAELLLWNYYDSRIAGRRID